MKAAGGGGGDAAASDKLADSTLLPLPPLLSAAPAQRVVASFSPRLKLPSKGPVLSASLTAPVPSQVASAAKATGRKAPVASVSLKAPVPSQVASAAKATDVSCMPTALHPPFIDNTTVFVCTMSTTFFTSSGSTLSCQKLKEFPWRTYTVEKDVGGTLFNVPFFFVYEYVRFVGATCTTLPFLAVTVGNQCIGWRGFSSFLPQPQLKEVSGSGRCVGIAVDRWNTPAFYLIHLDVAQDLGTTEYWFDSVHVLPWDAPPDLQAFVARKAQSRTRVAGGGDPPSQKTPMTATLAKFFLPIRPSVEAVLCAAGSSAASSSAAEVAASTLAAAAASPAPATGLSHSFGSAADAAASALAPAPDVCAAASNPLPAPVVELSDSGPSPPPAPGVNDNDMGSLPGRGGRGGRGGKPRCFSQRTARWLRMPPEFMRHLA